MFADKIGKLDGRCPAPDQPAVQACHGLGIDRRATQDRKLGPVQIVGSEDRSRVGTEGPLFNAGALAFKARNHGDFTWVLNADLFMPWRVGSRNNGHVKVLTRGGEWEVFCRRRCVSLWVWVPVACDRVPGDEFELDKCGTYLRSARICPRCD